jgi:hypothetical protein
MIAGETPMLRRKINKGVFAEASPAQWAKKPVLAVALLRNHCPFPESAGGRMSGPTTLLWYEICSSCAQVAWGGTPCRIELLPHPDKRDFFPYPFKGEFS